MIIKKPTELYHGSPRGDIEEFIPKISSGSGEAAGPQVYASQDRLIATIFTCNLRGIRWGVRMIGTTLHVSIVLTREEFMERDTGGYIYVLPSDSFVSDSSIGLGEDEWASPVPVKPLRKIRIESSLNAMLESSVKVYFVTLDQYLKMISMQNEEFDMFVRGLEGGK